MPVAKIKSVLAVSSEDKSQSAKNLLQQEHGKKWLTAKHEETATVLLELEEASTVTGIDIGNEHSAFVAVLVGNSLDTTTNFHEILPASSFMTPSESRNSANPNRVRCFAHDALLPSIASQQWRMVKLVCTQPFNTHVPYGLAFMKIHILETKPKPDVQIPSISLQSAGHNTNKYSPKKFALRLREDSSDSNSEDAFKRWKHSGTEDKQPVAHEAANITKLAPHPKTPQAPTKANTLSPRANNTESISRNATSKHSKTKPVLNEKPLKMSSNDAKSPIIKKKDTGGGKLNVSNATIPAQNYRSFNRLMHGVVFVISGIQNPDRSELRRKAIALGAKYEPDWSTYCTHLICAFENTPKYNEVKGKGKIVTLAWIEDCYKLKKYLPWRKYALADSERSQDPSDDEIWDKSLQPDDKKTKPTEKENSYSRCESKADVEVRISSMERKRKTPREVFEVTTDEEEQLKTKICRNSTNFFEGVKFFICEDDASEKSRIVNTIQKFHGVCSSSLDECDLAVSTDGHIDANYKCKLIKPDWIFECQDMEMAVPKTPYLFSK